MIRIIIYKVTNLINGKIYIGQTVHTLDRRRKQHENAHKYSHSENFIISKAIKKYGKENFQWEIIDRANTLEELNHKEEFWIKELGSHYSTGNGYNEKYGGDNKKHSELTKKKISEAQKGENGNMYGKTGKLNPTSKKVINITTNMIFGSACEASRYDNTNFSHVCAVCRGTRASTGGYVYRYVDDNNIPIEPENKPKKRKVKVKNETTGEIFDTVTKAAESVSSTKSVLSKGLKRNNGRYKLNGNMFKIVE